VDVDTDACIACVAATCHGREAWELVLCAQRRVHAAMSGVPGAVLRLYS